MHKLTLPITYYLSSPYNLPNPNQFLMSLEFIYSEYYHSKARNMLVFRMYLTQYTKPYIIEL